ncbi:MAG: hypothetical protein ACAI34_10015 [Verrucomicrobium sp.]|nr:hypothetical protein [Verrucomicrobium sp.]
MKSLSLLLLATTLALLASCASKPPAAPGSDAYSGEKESAYRKGYHLGFQDGKRRRDDDSERYYYDYNQLTEKAFEKGYDLGYEAGNDQADATEVDRDAAQNHGYEAGRSDSENGVPPLYQRHRESYNLETESSFSRGYQKGYREGRAALKHD